MPLDRPLRRGDVVVAETDSGPVIKRVALLPGDRRLQWRTRPESEWIDTTTVSEPRSRTGRSRMRSIAVPHETVFLLGDNLDVSVDSRTYGPVPVSRIKRLVVDIREPNEASGAATEIVRRWVMRGIKRFRPERLTASLRTYSPHREW
jgi:signal peptidase I